MRPGESLPAPGKTLESITVLLHAWQRGDADAFARVVQAVHGQLLRMAASRLQGHDSGTLAQGDVLNEAMLRLMQAPSIYHDRAHFFANVALTMRSVLRDHARARLANKRGGDRVRVTLNSVVAGEESMAADLLTLDRLLDTLARHDPRAAQVMELTYFVGLPRQEIAELLAVSVPTVDRELRFSRAWLAEQLGRNLEA
jgi:RNA polymerase sigma factor (TIGR02999 family)